MHEAATGEALGRVPMAGAADVERAMQAARRAFPAWSGTPVAERAAAIHALADGLMAREAELAELMAREVGTPLASSVRVQVGLAVSVFRSMADLALELPAEERIGTSLVLRQPVGVVVGITPWNYPLYQLAAKVGPALAAGCTTVVKPSSVAPLATFVLAQIAHETGLPPGVLNLLSGRGAVVGEVLAAHPETDMVSITGSTEAGARVAAAAAAGITKVTLELGGKSAFLLVEGADLEAATAAAVRGCFVNNGQTCSATTRLLVPSASARRGRGADPSPGLGLHRGRSARRCDRRRPAGVGSAAGDGAGLPRGRCVRGDDAGRRTRRRCRAWTAAIS